MTPYIPYAIIDSTTTYEQLCQSQKNDYFYSAKQAVQNGNFNLVQSLFDIHGHNLFLNSEGYSLLHYAFFSHVFTFGLPDNSHVYQMAKKIIELGCPINEYKTTPLEHAVLNYPKLPVTVLLFRLGGTYTPIDNLECERHWTLVKQNCMTKQEKQFSCGYTLDDNCTLKVFPKEIIDVILLSSSRLLRDENELLSDVQYSCL